MGTMSDLSTPSISSLVREVEFWQTYSSDTDASEPSSANLAPSKSYSPGSATGACLSSPSSATFERSMVDPTEAELTSWLADFPASRSAVHLEDARWLMISGRTCSGSWQMSLPGASLPRTLPSERLSKPRATSPHWATPSSACLFPRQTWVVTTFGGGIGYLHTPTTKANYAAKSMQKWPCARDFVRVFGRPSPEAHEYLMGWPDGWSDTRPLEMGKFLSWQQQHGECFPLPSPSSTESKE